MSGVECSAVQYSALLPRDKYGLLSAHARALLSLKLERRLLTYQWLGSTVCPTRPSVVAGNPLLPRLVQLCTVKRGTDRETR
jgi:hypothetical protein